jgi:hypothetical protein
MADVFDIIKNAQLLINVMLHLSHSSLPIIISMLSKRLMRPPCLAHSIPPRNPTSPLLHRRADDIPLLIPLVGNGGMFMPETLPCTLRAQEFRRGRDLAGDGGDVAGGVVAGDER